MTNITPWFVMVLGMATVFAGLIALIFLTHLTSKLCGAARRKGR